MKIGILTPGFSAHEHDWAIPVLQNLVVSLARTHDLRVLTLRYPFEKRQYTLGKARVTSLGAGNRGGVNRLPLLLKALQSVLRAHRADPFDLLHAFWLDEPAFTAILTGRLLQVPVLGSIMGGELVGFPELQYGGQLSRINRHLTQISLLRAKIVTTGSGALMEQVRQMGGRQQITLLPLGVDAGRFVPQQARHRSSETRLRLLCVGSLVAIKDHETLLRAAARLVEDQVDFRLDVVGAGPLEKALKASAAAKGIQELVSWHGAIRHTEMPAEYSRADLVVVSSRFESQSLVLLEAGACGVPVVGTAVGALPDLLPESLLAPPGDPAALAARIRRLAENPVERQASGRNLLERVRGDYTLDHTLDKLEKLYVRIAS